MRTFGIIHKVGPIDRSILGITEPPQVYVSILIPDLGVYYLTLRMPEQGVISFGGGLQKPVSELKAGDDIPLTFPDDLKDKMFDGVPVERFGLSYSMECVT
jgi:hypothetical protein